MQKKRSCPKCDNNQRDDDFNTPCDLCGAKQYSLIGYRYPQEAKEIFTTIRIVGFLVVIAILIGIIFLVTTQLQLVP
jgi:uncharacterized protein (DUF983 family)